MTEFQKLKEQKSELKRVQNDHKKAVAKMERVLNKQVTDFEKEIYKSETKVIKELQANGSGDIRESNPDNVVVFVRKASTIFIDSVTGKGVVIGKKNSYGEFKVWVYNVKRGEIIFNSYRGSVQSVKRGFF